MSFDILSVDWNDRATIDGNLHLLKQLRLRSRSWHVDVDGESGSVFVPYLEASVDDGWREDAACVGVPVDVFFPAKGHHREQRRAMLICGSCPVRGECLVDSLESDGCDPQGIRGGVSAAGRRKMRRFVAHGNADYVKRGRLGL